MKRVKMSIQVPEETRRQIEWLQAYYSTFTGVLIVAVAALYRDQVGKVAVERVGETGDNRRG